MFTLQVTKRGCFNAPLLNRPFAFHRRNSRCATVLVKAGRIKSSWISTDRGETDPARIVGEMKPDIVIERRPVIWVGDRPVDPPIDCNYLVFSESTDLLRENVRSYELSGARWIVAVLGNHSIRSTSADETDHAHFRESRRRRILGKRSPGVRWCRRRSSAGINVLQPPRCGGGEQDAQQQREEQRPAPQTCPLPDCRGPAVNGGKYAGSRGLAHYHGPRPRGRSRLLLLEPPSMVPGRSLPCSAHEGPCGSAPGRSSGWRARPSWRPCRAASAPLLIVAHGRTYEGGATV